MSNENGLMVMDQPLAIMPVMSIQQAVERRAAMVEFVQKIMVKDVDYGRPPGIDKDTLYKAGAEKLNTLFGLSPHFDMVDSVQDWTGADHNGEPFFNFSYRCTLRRGSYVAGQGEGSCNSWEKKYRYRRAELACPHCGQAAVTKSKYDDGYFCWGKKGGCGAKFGGHDPAIVDQPRGDILNPNPADLVNTLQKMAQKRALVAATLLAVNASEFFTQDVEDMAGFGDDIIDGQWMPADTLSDERQAGPPPVQQRKQRVSKPAPPEEPQGADELDELFHVDPESALFKGFMARGLAKFGDEWDEKRRAAVSKTTKGRTTSSLECTPAEIAKMNRFLGPVSDEEE